MARTTGFAERFALLISKWSGSSWAFALAVGTILVWGITGPLFAFSDTWQLVINTGTTIVTFLMVFLIQRFQNKESLALQLKLNELVAATRGASNRLISVEDLSEREVESLHRHYGKLVALARNERELTESHSIEEAEGRHRAKHETSKPWQSVAGGAAAEANGTPSPRQEPAATEALGTDAVARFLRAAQDLQDHIRWHEQQKSGHEQAIAAAKAVLDEHGCRLKKLMETANAGPAAEKPDGAGADRRPA
jgi:low affinity Fe/Cu permease